MTPESAPAPRDASPTAGSAGSARPGGSGGSGGSALRAVRRRLATLLWLVAAACATLLVAGALCVVLGADRENPAVSLVLEAADRVDLGVLSREDAVVEFAGAGAAGKDALVTWGLAAVAWLVAGRVLAALVRPRDGSSGA
jgi:hypothetical protein